MRPTIRAAAVGLLVSLGACGGSGDGGGGGASGSFHVASIAGRFTTAAEMETIFGRATVDSAVSTVAFDVDVNSEGTVTPGDEALPARLESDGTFALLTDGMGGPTDFLRGALADDGRVVVLGSVATGSRPLALLMVRTSGSVASAANLAGNYHVVLLQHPAGPVGGLVGQATFDGVGLGQILPGATRNDEGVITSLILPTPLQFAVAADGGTTLTALGFDFRGGLREGGGFLAVSGAVQNGGQPGMFAFVRAATAASVATFAGTYAVMELRYAHSITTFSSITATAQADGAGAFSSTGTRNEEGTILADVGSNTYTVAADGTLTIGSTRGAVSPDGRFAILGTIGVNFGPSIRILVRR